MNNNLDKQYQQLLQTILDFGVEKQDRTGTGTKSIFGYTIRHDMKDGFPLLTTKKMAWKSIVTELMWFLRGDTNIKFLVNNGCHIWDGDAYKSFKNSFPIKKSNPPKDYINEDGQLLTQEEFINKIKTDDEFAKKWGELGPIYGKQWRKWDTSIPVDQVVEVSDDGEFELEYNSTDQIINLINELKTNPDSRRLMVSAWNVGELDQMVLPPCHNFWQMYSVEKEGKRYLSMMVNIRSNDIPLGLPFNIASYGLLLEILAKEVNMVPDDLIINIGDAHIYLNQMEGIKEQLIREPFELPKLRFTTWANMVINDGRNLDWILEEIDTYEDWFVLENYQSHPSIKLPLSN